MKRLFGLLVLVLLTVVSSSALAEDACLEGDVLMGPNCIHAEARPGRDPMTTVYRVEDEKVATVWTGVGTVLKSTTRFIVVEEPTDDGKGGVQMSEVRHNWTGSAYER